MMDPLQDGYVKRKNPKNRQVDELKRVFTQRAERDRSNYLNHVAIERRLTARVLSEPEFTALARNLARAQKMCERAAQKQASSTTQSFPAVPTGVRSVTAKKLPYCLQQYVVPYQGVRYVSKCCFTPAGDIQHTVFASPSPYGVLGDPAELFSCVPQTKAAAPVDALLESELEEIMTRIAKHVHEASGQQLGRLVAEFIIDRFGQVMLQTIADYEWRASSSREPSSESAQVHRAALLALHTKMGDDPGEADTLLSKYAGRENAMWTDLEQRYGTNEFTPKLLAPLPPQPSDRNRFDRPRPPGSRPGGVRRPFSARVRASRPCSQKGAIRPKSARLCRTARPCRDDEVTELSKALQSTNYSMKTLQSEVRKTQSEAEVLRQELAQKERNAQVLRAQMKREWENAMNLRQDGKGGVDSRLDTLAQTVKEHQQQFGTSMSRSMLTFRDELIRLHQEFDRRDRDNLDRIHLLEKMVKDLDAQLKMSQHAPVPQPPSHR